MGFLIKAGLFGAVLVVIGYLFMRFGWQMFVAGVELMVIAFVALAIASVISGFFRGKV